MLDPDFKKKIANTISRYELKCDSLKVEIDTLKNALEQLVIAPGSSCEYSSYFLQFRNQLDGEFEPAQIRQKVKHLSELLGKIQKKKKDKSQAVISLLGQSLESLSTISHRPSQARALSKLHKMLQSETEVHVFLAHFNETLTQALAALVKEMDELNRTASKATHTNVAPEISSRVNDSLQQLLNHLFIPQSLEDKKEYIKNSLEQKLNGEALSTVIDGLTELVVDAFNVEQNRFKGFLQELTNQLHDFDSFLTSAAATTNNDTKASCLLEDDIKNDILQIQNHLDTSKTIDELSSKINQNLAAIGSRIKEYREHKEVAESQYMQEINRLHVQLSESECRAREINELITMQKYRINHDSLTGLPNRESYEEHLYDSMQAWQRAGAGFSLAVGDIDHFKRINDNFGHLAGDKVLKKVALLLKSAIREHDFIARIGGEEFVLIFNQTTSDIALPILQQLRQLIEECQFFYHEHKVEVTISFGLTSVITHDDAESIFIRADNAMYKAKNSGRNCIEII